MKKFMTWYAKATAVRWVGYVIVAAILSVIAKFVKTNEDGWNYVGFMSTMMWYTIFSPYYMVKSIFKKRNNKEEAAD